MRFRVGIAWVLLGVIAAGAAVLVFGLRPTALPQNAQEVALQPTATALPPATATTVAQIKVYVTGAVIKPGVYTLDAGARVEQAVQAAGGPAADAAMESINLAAPVHDGEQITVPRIGQPTVAPPAATKAPASNGETPPAQPININTASAADFETLPGIGPVLAQRIVDYRQQHGPFAALEDLMNVQGIGDKLFEKIKPYISIGG